MVSKDALQAVLHPRLKLIGRDILLEDENEPPMAGGRRERRPNR